MIVQLAKMSAMRDLRREHRLTARSLPELIGWIEEALLRHRLKHFKFRGRKLSGEAVVNAALLHFLSQSEDEQAAILKDQLVRLEQMLDVPESEPLEAARWLSPRDTTQATERAARKPKRGGSEK